MLITMKKRILILFAAFLLLILLPIIALFIPPVQSKLIQTIASQQSGLTLTYDALYVGPSRTQIKNLEVHYQGAHITIADAEVAYPLTEVIKKRGIVIQKGKILGLNMNLRHLDLPATPTPSPPKETPSDAPYFPGLDAFSQLPIPVFANRLKLTGNLILPNPREPQNAFQIQFDGEGNNIAPGTTAQFDLASQIFFKVGDQDYPAFQAKGIFHAEQTVQAKITSFAFKGTLFPIGELAREDQGLKYTLDAHLTHTSETYEHHLQTLGDKNPQTLVKASTQFTALTQTVITDLEINLKDDQLAPFIPEITLPDFIYQGTGHYTFELPGKTLHAVNKLTLEGDNWSQLDSSLSGISYVKLQSSTEFFLEPTQIQVAQADIQLVDSAQQPLLTWDMDQGFSFQFSNRRIGLKHIDQPFLRLSLNSFPLHWLQAFSPQLTETQGLLDGEWVISPEGLTTLAVKTIRPLQSESIQLALADSPPLPSITFSCTPEARYAPEGLKMQITNSALKLSTGPQLAFQGSFNLPPNTSLAQLEGTLDLRFPQLYNWIGNIEVFRAQGDFELNISNLVAGIKTLQFALNTTSDESLIDGALTTQTPLSFDLKTQSFDWPNFEPEALTYKIQKFPIAWISHLLPNIKITSGELFGELKATKDKNGNPLLENVTPFEARDVTLDWKTWRLINQTSLSLKPTVEFADDALNIHLNEIQMRAIAGDWMDGAFAIDIPYRQKERIHFSGKLAAGFPALTSWLVDLKSFSSQLKGALYIPDNTIEIEHMAFDLSNSQQKKFIQGRTLQPYRLKTRQVPYTIIPSTDDKKIFSATFIPLPIEEVFPHPLGLSLKGQFPEGEILISAQDEGMLFQTSQPIHFDAISVHWQDILLLDRIGFKMHSDISLEDLRLEARRFQMDILGQDQPIAHFNSQGFIDMAPSPMTASLKTNIDLFLPPLLEQPINRGFHAFQAGKYSAQLELDINESISFDLKNQFKGLHLEGADQPLADVLIAPSIILEDGNTFKFTCPISFTTPQDTSDLLIQAELTPDASGYKLNSTITGQQIVVDDIQDFIQAFLPLKESDTPETDSSPQKAESTTDNTLAQKWLTQKDTRPFWGEQLSSEVQLDIANLKVDQYQATQLKGQLSVVPSQLTITDVNMEFLGARYSSEFDITFDAEHTNPYNFHTAFKLQDLEMSTVFLKVQPEEEPTLEGNFQIKGLATGQGLNPINLLYNTFGKIEIESQGGIFRGLKGGTQGLSFLTGTVGLITLSKEFRAISRLIKQLEAFPYERLQLTLARNQHNQFSIETFSLSSPEIQANGHGSIQLIEDHPVAQSPIEMSMQLFTLGDMKILFEGMKLLHNTPGPNGYYPLQTPFKIDGTLSAPDASQLYQQLEMATENAKGSFGWALRIAKKKIDQKLDNPDTTSSDNTEETSPPGPKTRRHR